MTAPAAAAAALRHAAGELSTCGLFMARRFDQALEQFHAAVLTAGGTAEAHFGLVELVAAHIAAQLATVPAQAQR